MSVPLDTSPEAAALQIQACRELGLAGRLRVALDLSDLTRAFAIAGIRQRHPDFSEDEVMRKLVEVLYGLK